VDPDGGLVGGTQALASQYGRGFSICGSIHGICVAVLGQTASAGECCAQLKARRQKAAASIFGVKVKMKRSKKYM